MHSFTHARHIHFEATERRKSLREREREREMLQAFNKESGFPVRTVDKHLESNVFVRR